jgi:DNA sulfur modification protein DndE
MLINVRTSEKNQSVVKELTSKLNAGGAAIKENVIARIAIAFSVSGGKKFLLNEIKDSKGKEYKDHILFDQKYKDFYVALICQHYGIYKTDENITKYIKLHLDDGLEKLEIIFNETRNYTIYDFLLEHLEKGIEQLEGYEVSLDAVKNFNQNINKEYFTAPIKLVVGKNIDTHDEIVLNANNTSLYNNFHIAVAGKPGSGKTQFALELLSQYYKCTNGKVNFIYLDFKGLKNEDKSNLAPFFEATKTKLIDAPLVPFPLNPLSFIDNINEMNKKMGISKFVDIIAKYSNIGKKQQQILKDATREAFNEKKSGEYPSLKDIYKKVIDIVGDKRDTLTEILDGLSDYQIFESKPNYQDSFLLKNYYLSLSGELPNAVRFTSVFLIINYIYNTFMNMENTLVENNYQGIRYVLLIDEAHVIFKEKKSQDILEKLLREVRSKGVSVVLLSQGIEEFNQPSFDFSTMCEIAFLLEIKDKSSFKTINKFLGFGELEGKKVARNMEKMQKGQAISNIKEFEKGNLLKITQLYENN